MNSKPARTAIMTGDLVLGTAVATVIDRRPKDRRPFAVQAFADRMVGEVWKRMTAKLTLAKHESAASRVVLLEDPTKSLSGTPVDVQDYFSEASLVSKASCTAPGSSLLGRDTSTCCRRSATKKHEADIRAARMKWAFKDLAELKELVAESQFLIVAKDVKFTTQGPASDT